MNNLRNKMILLNMHARLLLTLGSTIICCTPSYAANLGEVINERGLRDRIKLKAGIFGAAPSSCV